MNFQFLTIFSYILHVICENYTSNVRQETIFIEFYADHTVN